MSEDDDRLDRLDYYTLLGVARDADADAIKRALRTFARRYHPDRFVGAPQDKIDRATRIYRRGSEAIQTLTDLNGRRAYDAGLAKGELRLRSDARAGASPPQQAAARPATPERGAARPGAATPAAAAPTIRSPSARAFFTKAQEASRAGDLKTAYRHVKSAMEQEPGNPVLEQALIKLERALRGS
jgi:curved DNA-binding protein CbpA